MAVTTFEIPAQRTYDEASIDHEQQNAQHVQEPNWPEVGEWALLTVYKDREVKEIVAGHPTGRIAVEQSVENFRGFVALTPETTPSHATAYNRDGSLRYRIPRAPIYHLTQVHLIEADGEFTYTPQPDRIISEKSEGYTLQSFSSSVAAH